MAIGVVARVSQRVPDDAVTRTIRVSGVSEQKPHLELKHARRIDVGECRKRVRRTTNCDDLTERWIGRSRIAVDRLRTPENVRVIEDIEALESQENGSF